MQVGDNLNHVYLLQIALGLLGSAIAVPVYRYYHSRAEVRDHVAEVFRDVQIPHQCAGCMSPDAPFRYTIESNIVGPGALLRMMTASQNAFAFRFCLQCSRLVRRHRRFANTIIIGGIAAIVSVPLVVFALTFAPAIATLLNHGTRHWGDWLFFTLVTFIFAGIAAVAVGAARQNSAVPIAVMDAGDATIFFSFESQAFRDAFAALNGRP